MMESQSLDFSAWRHAQKCIAQGSLTNSKHPRSHVMGAYPTHVTNGERCYLYDTAGNRYIDYICGLGTCLVGYNNATIVEAITSAARAGISHSLPSTFELDAADSIKAIIPWVERVKFTKTGTESCMASLIMARAATGRRKVLTKGYNGWSPEFTTLTPPHRGCLKYDDIERLEEIEQIDGDVAAVIVEPILLDDSRANREWLREVRDACDYHGVVLIYDETICALRVPKLSVSEYYKIRPDLLIMGKALGGGAAISCVCGKAEIMDGDYFVSGTFAGETIGLAAAKATIGLVTRKPDYYVDNLWRAGANFMDEFNAVWEGVQLKGYPSRGRFIGEPLHLALFFQEMVTAGVLFGPSWFFNQHLEAETKNVINIATDVLIRIKEDRVQLRGEMPRSPFAMKVRDEQKN